MQHIKITTEDQEFLSDLEAAKIDGIRIWITLHAAADANVGSQILPFAIEIVKYGAAPILIAWLKHRISKNAAKKTSINGIEITNNTGSISIVVNQIVQQEQANKTNGE